MDFNRVKIIFLLLCATILVGVPVYAETLGGQTSSLRIGMFNSQKKAQVFFEAIPENLKHHIHRNQLWVNTYQTPSGLTEHHLEISQLTNKQSQTLCAYIKQQEMQCFISSKEMLPPSSFVSGQAVNKEQQIGQKPDSVVSSSGFPKMLQPLGMRLPRVSGTDTQNLDLAFSEQLTNSFTRQKSIDDYGNTFSLEPQYLDTQETQAAKAAYEVARNQFINALQNIGEGVNTGQGDSAAREQLMALGQNVFETAGSIYLSGFLDKELGQAAVLSSDAGSGEIFIHHVKKNLGKSAKNTVESLIHDLSSNAVKSGSSDFYTDKIDAVMLSGARGLIDAGLAVAKRSDFYALRNMELEYNINNFENSYLSALITQPVYQSVDLRHNIFFQGSGILNEKSIDIDDDVARHTINIGAAYRYLTVDEKYLLGGNVFFDHQWPYNHSRLSIGLDAKTKDLNLAANYYYPLTGFQDSRHDANGLGYEERALEGYDFEIGYTLPFLQGMSIFSKSYQYFRETDDDIRGVELSAEYNIRDNFTLKGSVIEENGGRDGVELTLQYRMPLYDEAKPNLALAAMEPAAGNDSVRSKILEKVRRENRVRVEERLKAVPAVADIITAQFNALSIGLPFDVGGVSMGAGVNLPFNTAITVPNGDFGIITFSNGAIANVSASGGGDVIFEFNATTLTVTTTNGGFVQFISGNGGGITVVNVPGGAVNLLGTDIDVTDDGTTTTIQVRAGQIEVIPAIGVAVLNGNQADVVSLTIASGTTSLLVNPALENRQEAAYTNLDLINPDPPTTEKSAPFINVAPALITGPQFIGNNADLRLTFTQAVTVAGTPFINGFIDANARTFSYNASSSTPTQLVFRHIYLAGDVGAAAITINDLNLNGGTIIGTNNVLSAITAFTPTVVPITDQTAPMLTGSTPVDNEPAFNSGSNIVLNFDENVQANIGNIILTDTTDGSDTHIIPIGDAQVTIVGSTVTINPTGILDLTTDYDLVIGADVIRDTTGNAFAGITTGNLNFTTSNDVTPPTFNPATDSSPADDDVDVVPTENITITFSEAVNKGGGNIEIRRTADNALLETIDVTTGLVTGGGTNTITINPANDYPLATDVYVLIDAGAFEDLVGNPYAGIASTTAFNFRGFAPLDVSGLLLWLDAHDLDGDGAPEGAAEGGLVSGAASIWKDKSGNNNNLSHGTASSRPTLTVAGKNGRDILSFDGGDALYATDASVPSLDLSGPKFTMYMVLNPTNTNGRILVNKENSYEVALNSGNVQAAVLTTAPGGWNWGGTANNSITTAWHTVEFAHNNTMWDFYQDGTLTESIVPASNQTGNIQPSNNIFTVGGRGTAAPTGSFFLGDIAEVLMFDHALTAPERTALQTYLTDKWGL
ncbi:MAG: inverse autotransporter beta domain-containing protein [Alphaproteobacteria bacterium]|nr:inverse autotransporter beta domain-containing protein [Alphaproteobacteria bacterium]